MHTPVRQNGANATKFAQVWTRLYVNSIIAAAECCGTLSTASLTGT